MLFQQVRDAIRCLRASGEPKVRAREIDSESLFAPGRDRIEKTQALDIAAVSTIASIRDDDVVERALGRTAAGETNDHHRAKDPGKNTKAVDPTAL
jgi:hypothetical protein